MTHTPVALLIVGACAALLSASAGQVTLPKGALLAHDVRPGPGVTTRLLSDYLPSLAGTPGDTRVYVIEGKEAGGTVFVAGGTHGNEIAGSMAAVVLVERASAQKGRLIVIPHANNSAMTWVDPRVTAPETFTVKTASGVRSFRFGSRYTRREHQGAPDPPKYHHPASTEELEGAEARNLDRAHPGKADGNLTERVAFAMTSLIRQEGADLAFDFHEAGVNSRLASMIVANPKNIEVAAAAVLALEVQNITMKLEPSSDTFRGLSHREWGDATQAQSYLFETPSPAFETKGTGNLVHHPDYPLAMRVGLHCSSMMAVIEAYDEGAKPDRRIVLTGVPSLEQANRVGLEGLLR